MRRPIMAGNWKMYKTAAEAAGFLQAFVPLVRELPDRGIVICPPFNALETAIRETDGTNIAIGAQNMHWAEEGAYTGEVAPGMLQTAGCRYVIIGHSERRQLFGEKDETVNYKVKAALKHNLTPIMCVGETLAEREQGQVEEICGGQTRQGLDGLAPEDIPRVVIAYEPVWAIGTGRTASAADAQTAIAFIRQVVAGEFGAAPAAQIRILYGGSVKPENAAELMAQPDLDGALVGGASLDPVAFAAIVRAAKEDK